jgi:hypothetical protein
MEAKSLVVFVVLIPLVAFCKKTKPCLRRQVSAAMRARDRNIQVMLEMFPTLEERDPSRRTVNERAKAL